MGKIGARSAALLAVILTAGAAAGCSGTKPPDQTGVCYHMIERKDGHLQFNTLAENVPNIETCAQKLEIMRLQFLRLGGTRTSITGAYQGQFIWLEKRGVSVSQSLDGIQYALLKRMPDGSLAIPSAVPQP